MRKYRFIYLLLIACIGIIITTTITHAQSDAQSNSPTPIESAKPKESKSDKPTDDKPVNDRRVEQRGKDIPSFEQQKPKPEPNQPATPIAIVNANPSGQYALEFNRSPVVGNRFYLHGIYDEARLGFTRPRNWRLKSVKALVRYRHSGALYATRSNLTVRINNTSVGSIPLDRKQGEVGSVVFDVPPNVIQDYNDINITALQNNSPTCTQDPYDPSLWTEILPDSKISFDFQPQPTALDFNSYPYPIFDNLSLETNQVAYLLPNQIGDAWLNATTRFNTALGRLADYRALDTRLVRGIDQLQLNERLVIVGTPAEQPVLKSLALPFRVKNDQVLDDQQKALPPDTGVLMLTTTPGNKAAVLVATGNGPLGVAKAVQFLVQSQERKLGTGQSILVKNLTEVPTPALRDWPGYLPLADSFQMRTLKDSNNKSLEDVMVRGSDAPPIEFNFRALPDDEFASGNSMNLVYSYGPQVNPTTSLVEVQIDGVGIYGKRLSSINGGTRESLQFELPRDRIKSNSKMQVYFRLDPRERRSCSRVTSQQLWGTLHADTSFELKRENTVQLPDLKLLQSGFPFAAPQDLSSTAIVLPDSPTDADLMTLLEFSKRMGRLSKADSVKIEVYKASKFPSALRGQRQLVGIGNRDKFPFPEVLKSPGFGLGGLFSRQLNQTEVQVAPDEEGAIKQVISPYAGDRVLLALTAQTDTGLAQVQGLLKQDPLFFQIHGDTVLVAKNPQVLPLNSPEAYNLEFFERESKIRIENTNIWSRILRLLRNNWLVLAPAIMVASLVLYGVIQTYLKQMPQEK